MIWQQLINTPEYFVSIYGEVLSLKNKSPRVLLQSDDGKGYMVVNIDGGTKFVHRLVASAFLGLDISNSSMVVMHKDDNPKNNKLYNLAIGSQKDNIADAKNKGRNFIPKGKISSKDVFDIRSRLLSGEKGIDLASEYGVSVSLISAIKNNKRRIV